MAISGYLFKLTDAILWTCISLIYLSKNKWFNLRHFKDRHNVGTSSNNRNTIKQSYPNNLAKNDKDNNNNLIFN